MWLLNAGFYVFQKRCRIVKHIVRPNNRITESLAGTTHYKLQSLNLTPLETIHENS